MAKTLKHTINYAILCRNICWIGKFFISLHYENPPSLSTMLKCAGRFFHVRFIMATTIPFGKHYSEPHDLVRLLKSRGLSVKDDVKVQHYLEHIGYYRLSAYMYPLLKLPKEQHVYKPGVSFDRVMMLYRFDKKLRLLLFNEIEKIEVAIRSAIVNIATSMIGDPFWMTNIEFSGD